MGKKGSEKVIGQETQASISKPKHAEMPAETTPAKPKTKQNVTYFLHPDTHEELRQIAFDSRKPIQHIIDVALNAWLIENGHKPLVWLPAKKTKK
jgi:hypothetical protein